MSSVLPVPPLPEIARDDADPDVQLCAFFVGEVEYAIDIMRVDEILQPQPVTAVPHAPRWMDGATNLRGVLTPVIDLRRRLSVQGNPPRKLKPGVLVAFVGRRRVALLIDGVSGVVLAKRSELKPVPQVLAPGLSPAVLGARESSGRTVLLLDLKALLRD